MNLTLATDVDVGVEAPEVTCTGDAPPPRRSVCDASLEGGVGLHRPSPRTLPSLVEIDALPGGGLLTDVEGLSIEMDFFADVPRARACFVFSSDALPDAVEPLCARSGWVHANHVVSGLDDVATLQLEFEAEFDVATSSGPQALQLRGKL